MNPSDVELKRRLRAQIRAHRAARSPQDRSAARDALTSRLISLVQDREARSITCFVPLPDEPDVSGFLAWAAGADIEVLLPVSLADSQLAWGRLSPATPPSAENVSAHSLDELAIGRHGIAEPLGERLAGGAAAQTDLMLIPACAVDANGNRLGWGRGYFDRCLAALDPLPPVFAVVFDEDLVPRVPTEPHDVPVTGAVSPGGLFLVA